MNQGQQQMRTKSSIIPIGNGVAHVWQPTKAKDSFPEVLPNDQHNATTSRQRPPNRL